MDEDDLCWGSDLNVVEIPLCESKFMEAVVVDPTSHYCTLHSSKSTVGINTRKVQSGALYCATEQTGWAKCPSFRPDLSDAWNEQMFSCSSYLRSYCKRMLLSACLKLFVFNYVLFICGCLAALWRWEIQEHKWMGRGRVRRRKYREVRTTSTKNRKGSACRGEKQRWMQMGDLFSPAHADKMEMSGCLWRQSV